MGHKCFRNNGSFTLPKAGKASLLVTTGLIFSTIDIQSRFMIRSAFLICYGSHQFFRGFRDIVCALNDLLCKLSHVDGVLGKDGIFTFNLKSHRAPVHEIKGRANSHYGRIL